jgi:hypothetical protein
VQWGVRFDCRWCNIPEAGLSEFFVHCWYEEKGCRVGQRRWDSFEFPSLRSSLLLVDSGIDQHRLGESAFRVLPDWLCNRRERIRLNYSRMR